MVPRGARPGQIANGMKQFTVTARAAQEDRRAPEGNPLENDGELTASDPLCIGTSASARVRDQLVVMTLP